MYVPTLGVQCPAGQYYETCGNSCQRTCHDISVINTCKSNCVEGCYCPKGLTLSDSGECIPVSECSCHYNGQKYKSNQKRIETNANGKQLCTCKSATWECRLAEKFEIANWKEISESSCSSKKHLTYTECESSEPVTCRVSIIVLFFYFVHLTILSYFLGVFVATINVQKLNALFKILFASLNKITAVIVCFVWTKIE